VTTGKARLRALELQGYKTFATRCAFVFAPSITAIVGPNGSGKSNIADSLRWVLGEQSYSLLRGKKTEDMIFSGSNSRARAGMASASITFDNSTGWLPIDFSEVTIGRRAYRDGQNEYMINGQKVRLRDVSELLAKSGLAQRTYTIIGQGLVDAALSLKAEERRRLFEEAAGIGLYRSRREEALRRLETTRRNLERVKDILAELRPRLRSLERQAKRAQDYDQVKNDLQEALRVWYGFHYHQMLETVARARETAGLQARTRDELRQAQVESDRLLEETRKRIQELRAELQQWSQEASESNQAREELGRKLAVAVERRRWLDEQAENMAAEIASLEESQTSLRSRLTEAEGNQKAAQASLDELADQRKSATADAGVDLEQRQVWISRARSLRESLESLAGRKAAWETKREQAAARVADLAKQISSRRKAESEAETAVGEAAGAAAQADKRLTEAESAVESAQSLRRAAESDQADLRKRLDDGRRHLAGLQAEMAGKSGRLEAVRAFEAGPGKTIKMLAEAGQAGRISGVVGQVLALADYRSAHETALLASLGEFGHGLAFESTSELLSALTWIDGQSGEGRAALVPRAPKSTPKRFDPPQAEGVVGLARDLVDPREGSGRLFDLLLARTVVVVDRRTATSLIDDLSDDIRVVTLAGEIFYPGGAVVIGPASRAAAPEDAERLEAQVERLKGEVEAAQSALAGLEADVGGPEAPLSEAQARLESALQAQAEAQIAQREAGLVLARASARRDDIQASLQDLEAQLTTEREAAAEVEAAREDFEVERGRLETELQATQRRLQAADADVHAAQMESQWEMAQRALVDAQERGDELTQRLAALDRQLADRHARAKSNQQEREALAGSLAELEERSAEAEEAWAQRSEQMAPSEASLREAEKQRSALEIDESKLRADLRLAEHHHSQAQIELARREEELTSLKRRIQDDFGLVSFDEEDGAGGQEPLPIEGLVERLPRIDILPPEQESAVSRLRNQLRRMGSINPEAQQEYKEVRERVEFMTTQVDDLRSAESQLQDVIAELDVLMEREFTKTFEAVAVAFKETFHRLFGGGSARLSLTDPDDPNESGIEIEARLPGKREQGLAVLSGGERSLTACALVFALLRISPTPFCVLDEVDAMLDEANVDRFQELLTELSDETQFIVITHNRQTVQAAKAVYGISMGADSASKVISLDLDKAAREAAA
jgi:chromosome segregation protein